MIVDNINGTHRLPAGVDPASVIVRYRTAGGPWHVVKTRLVVYADTQMGGIVYLDSDLGAPVAIENAEVQFGFFARIPESDEGGDDPVSPDSLDRLKELVDSAIMDTVTA